MTQFYILRHAQTDFNVEHRLQGQFDAPLNTKGLQQAQQLAEKFPVDDFVAFYGSDLCRCQQTAQPLAKKLNLRYQPQADLREKHFGILQQYTHPQAAKKYPDIYQSFQQGDLFYRPPQGESQADFVARFIPCLQTLATKHPDDKVLIMTHGGVLASLLQHTLQLPSGGKRHFLLTNLSVNIFNYQPNSGWQLQLFGWDICHAV